MDNSFGDIGTLEQRTDLYHLMIDEIQDYAIILLDKNGIIRNWNKGAEKIKQYTAEEIIGRHFSTFYLPADLKTNLPQKLMKQAEETGRAAQEGWRKRKDGSRFWGSITITALHNDLGDVIAYCKVTRDLTDRKIAEDELKKSEERYHQMVAEVQDYAIILLSSEGIIENWNTGAEHIKGYKSEEIIGKKFEIFYGLEDRERKLPQQLLQEARENGKAMHEGWRVRKDGSKFWGTIVITALHNKSGDIIGFSKVTRDLTANKLAEDKLAAYTRELEIQNSELEQFAFVASHDLQEPLRKILTFAGLIQDRFSDTEFRERYFAKLSASAKRMSELIKSLLNYSRLSQEKEGSVSEKIDLNKVLDEVKEDLELLIEEKQATIINDQLPSIKGNAPQLSQLFSNLISNSLKFTKDKPGITIKYKQVTAPLPADETAAQSQQQFHCITLQDNGIGFEQKFSKAIFSMFQRLHGRQDYAGTGIGLALCKKIVENHDGFITAHSGPGQGATFKIYLPCEEV